MTYKLLAPALVALMMAGCGGASAQNESVDIAAVEQELDAVRASFETAVANGDMNVLFSIISPETIMVQPGSADWKAMQALAGGAPFAFGARIDISPKETTVINAEWAYEFGTSVITYPDADANTDVVLRDTYLILLRNQGDGWKPFREVASASPPPGGWPEISE